MIRLIVTALLLSGCATNPPVVEYTLARTALKAAKDASASRYSPGYWHKAETAYLRGQKFFEKEKYSAAAAEFQKTIHYAEKSENIARVEQLKAGEIP